MTSPLMSLVPNSGCITKYEHMLPYTHTPHTWAYIHKKLYELSFYHYYEEARKTQPQWSLTLKKSNRWKKILLVTITHLCQPLSVEKLEPKSRSRWGYFKKKTEKEIDAEWGWLLYCFRAFASGETNGLIIYPFFYQMG